LKKLTTEQITKGVRSFYGSILGLLNHILLADCLWLKRFCIRFPELDTINPKLPEFTMKGWKDIVWPSLPTLKPVRIAVDEAIQHVCELFPEQHYGSIMEYKNWDGKDMKKSVWLAFLHLFQPSNPSLRSHISDTGPDRCRK
jgi:uncharacterized damage-inducible protein DinB